VISWSVVHYSRINGVVDLSDCEQKVLTAAACNVMKRRFKARGAGIVMALLERAAKIDRLEGRIGPAGPICAMPVVLHNPRELADAENQRALAIADPETTSRHLDILLGLTGAPSRDELALLDAVDRTFRAALLDHAAELRAKKTEARDPDIDFQILWWITSGRTQRKIAKHFGIKQQLVDRIKRTRLQTIYRVIEPLQPTVKRPAPGGIRDAENSYPFGNFAVFEAEQRNFRSYGREDTIAESNKLGHSKHGPR
jgi:hypothetical protein